MKKILSVALSTAMAFSMFASVAFGDAATATTPEQKFEALKAQGIFNGYPDQQSHLERDMTRGEFAKVLTKLLGLKEITGVLSYKDVNYNAKNWAVPYIEAVSAAGVMEGKDTVKKIFDFNGKVTVEEMATVLQRALKLEVPANPTNNASDWAKGNVQAAIDKGYISKDANFKGNATRSQLVETAYAIAQAQAIPTVASYKVADSTNVEFTLSNGEVVKVKLEKALVPNTETSVTFKDAKGHEITAKITWKLESATKVEKVSASNLKEIDVAFDGKVDKSTAEDADRYSVDSSVSIDSASLQEDGKTVRLTVTGVLQNQKTYKITVRNVKAGDRTVSVTNLEFAPLDNALPEVLSVKSLGTKAVKVTFSEPVKSATSANFKLDGKTFFGSVSEGKRDVILKPYSSSDLAVGAHKLEVSGVSDYNDFKALSKSFDFEVVLDTTAPTIASVTATLEKATVTFSEEVDPDTVLASKVYWKSGSDKKTADKVVEVSPSVYEFSYKSNPFPGYETPFFVEGVKDYSGNEITATETKLRAEVDQTRPEVTEVTLKSTDNKKINIKFSKEVKVEDVKYFTLTKTNGDVVALKSVKGVNGTAEDKAFILETYDALSDNSYTLKIVGVRDTTKLNNTMLDYSATVSGKDTGAPAYVSNSGNSSTRTLYINFNKKMDPTTVGEKSNYLVTINNKQQQLPAGTEVTPVNEGKAVRIVFPQFIDNDRVGIQDSAFAANITAFTLLALKDLSGNVIDLSAGAVPINVAPTQPKAYEAGDAFQAKLTSEGTIKVHFDQPISNAKASDFTVNQGFAITSATADGSDIVVLKIAGGISKTGLTTQTGTTDLTLNIATGNTIRTVTGNTATPGSVTLHDGVKPQVQLASGVSRLAASGSTITLPFSEALKTGANDNEYRYDLVVTNIRTGDILDFNQYTTSVDTNRNNELLIKLLVTSTDDYKVKVKSDASFIQDRAGNKAESSSEYSSNVGSISVSTGVTGTASEVTKGALATNGTAQADSFTVGTTGATVAGTVTLTVDGTPVSVVVAANDTATVVAGNIVTVLNADTTLKAKYTFANTGAVVTATAKAPAAYHALPVVYTDAVPVTNVTVGSVVPVTLGVAPTPAVAEVNKLTVNVPAAILAGTNTVTFNDGTVNVPVTISVATNDTVATISTKIKDAFNAKQLPGYVVTSDATGVVFTAAAAAADKNVTITLN